MASIADNVAQVRQAIDAACDRVGRPPGVRLIAVTKSQGPEVLDGLRAAGVNDIGENRLEHMELMRSAAPREMDLHAIGRLQSRQVPHILRLAHTIHGLCDTEHLAILGRRAEALAATPEIFIQVNTSQEVQKAGLVPDDLPAFLDKARSLAGIQIVGLMTMAPDRRTGVMDTEIRDCFGSLARLAAAHGLSRLSMGMSQDFILAVEEGATDVRVGTRLFA